ncbi:MAG: hypothetical protein NT089_06270 [Planctomycetia bacterium]|nr:hypothetical protein [Planctomycetia bacterium]
MSRPSVAIGGNRFRRTKLKLKTRYKIMATEWLTVRTWAGDWHRNTGNCRGSL